jgi:hypothetical protein
MGSGQILEDDIANIFVKDVQTCGWGDKQLCQAGADIVRYLTDVCIRLLDLFHQLEVVRPQERVFFEHRTTARLRGNLGTPTQ